MTLLPDSTEIRLRTERARLRQAAAEELQSAKLLLWWHSQSAEQQERIRRACVGPGVRRVVEVEGYEVSELGRTGT